MIHSVKTFFGYHIGTVAFGSFLIALINMIRVIFEYFARHAKGLDQNKAGRCVIDCLRCCLYCFEACVRFVSKSAYIQTVMTSANFCGGAGDAIHLMTGSPLKIGMVHGLSTLFEYLGTLAIALSSTCICYLVITTDSTYTDVLSSPVAPTVCFFLLSLSVGDYFMSLYGTSADVVVVLYVMESETAQNQPGKDLYTPKELREFIHAYDKVDYHI